MDIVEQLISKVVKNVSEEATHYQSFANGYNRIDGNIPRISYQQCLSELASVGDKLEFGDDLSDASLEKTWRNLSWFLFYFRLANKAQTILYS